MQSDEHEQQLLSVEQSLHDSQQLLMDANKRVAEQCEQLLVTKLREDGLKQELSKLQEDAAQLHTAQTQLQELKITNKTLNRELVCNVLIFVRI